MLPASPIGGPRRCLLVRQDCQALLGTVDPLPGAWCGQNMAAAVRAPSAALSRPSTVSQIRQQRAGPVAVRAQKVEAQGAASGAVLDQPARQPSPAVNVIQPVTR